MLHVQPHSQGSPGFGFRAQGSGCIELGLGNRVEGLGFKGLGCGI